MLPHSAQAPFAPSIHVGSNVKELSRPNRLSRSAPCPGASAGANSGAPPARASLGKKNPPHETTRSSAGRVPSAFDTMEASTFSPTPRPHLGDALRPLSNSCSRESSSYSYPHSRNHLSTSLRASAANDATQPDPTHPPPEAPARPGSALSPEAALPPSIPSLYSILKLALAAALALGVLQVLFRSCVSGLLVVAPPVLTYAGMALVCWPWIAAFALGGATLYLAASSGASRGSGKGQSGAASSASAAKQGATPLWKQLVTLLGALTWLILVPCGHFQGYLGAWPTFLFFVYVAFFAESAFIRAWLYGDLSSRSQDKQWATPSSRLAQVGFIVALVSGHWLAAQESPLLSYAITGFTPGVNTPALLLLLFALWLHWDATLMLGKYFDRLVPPKAVVTTGPYRWIRHPIYTSYMLLFSGFCAGLRSYKSLAFVLAACLLYYWQRTRLEEDQLREHFGEEYEEYAKRVDKKFLPYLF